MFTDCSTDSYSFVPAFISTFCSANNATIISSNKSAHHTTFDAAISATLRTTDWNSD